MGEGTFNRLVWLGDTYLERHRGLRWRPCRTIVDRCTPHWRYSQAGAGSRRGPSRATRSKPTWRPCASPVPSSASPSPASADATTGRSSAGASRRLVSSARPSRPSSSSMTRLRPSGRRLSGTPAWPWCTRSEDRCGSKRWSCSSATSTRHAPALSPHDRSALPPIHRGWWGARCHYRCAARAATSPAPWQRIGRHPPRCTRVGRPDGRVAGLPLGRASGRSLGESLLSRSLRRERGTLAGRRTRPGHTVSSTDEHQPNAC